MANFVMTYFESCDNLFNFVYGLGFMVGTRYIASANCNPLTIDQKPKTIDQQPTIKYQTI